MNGIMEMIVLLRPKVRNQDYGARHLASRKLMEVWQSDGYGDENWSGILKSVKRKADSCRGKKANSAMKVDLK